MIRFLFRLLGFLILAAGFVALVIDGTRAIASGTIAFTATETSWAAASPDTLQAARDLVGSAGAGALAFVLAQPTALVLGLIGFLFMLIGRRRRRPVGVAP
jgi:ABC-type phosphate transport system permease subunit